MMRIQPMAVLFGALCCVAMSGCHDWVAIRPSEAPKLNGSFAAPTPGNSRTIAVRVVDVETPEGMLTQIKGEFDVRVNLKGGEMRDFTHPVRVDQVDDVFVFTGGNRPATRIRREDIESLEVSQYSQTKTILAMSSPGLLVGVVFGIILATDKR